MLELALLAFVAGTLFGTLLIAFVDSMVERSARRCDNDCFTLF